MLPKAVIAVAGLVGGSLVAATLPPESAVKLDMRFLSPAQVSPGAPAALVEQTQGYTRMSATHSRDGSNFTWALRNPVPARTYPIVVLRYRARELSGDRSSGEPTSLQMSLRNRDGAIVKEYHSNTDWWPAMADFIKNVTTAIKQAVRIPVILNGDVFTPQDAKRAFDETGCDAVMIARGALGNCPGHVEFR